MADFTFVSERVATGAALSSADDVASVAAAGITHVIDCRNDFDDTALFATHPAISVLWNGTADDGQPKDPSWFGKSLDFALSALARPNTRVLCHCAAGINRGPSTAYAVLRALGYHATLAESEIRTARPIVALAYKQDADRAITALGW